MPSLFLRETVRQVAVHTPPERQTDRDSAPSCSVTAPIMLCGGAQKLIRTSMIGRCSGRWGIARRSLRSAESRHTHICHTHICPARCTASRQLTGRLPWRRDNRSCHPSSRPGTHTVLTHTHPSLRHTDTHRVSQRSFMNATGL